MLPYKRGYIGNINILHFILSFKQPWRTRYEDLRISAQADTRRAAGIPWTTVATWAIVTTCHHEPSPWFHRLRAARALRLRATTSQGRLPPARRSRTAQEDRAWRLSIATTCPGRCNPSPQAARRPVSPTMDPSADRTGTRTAFISSAFLTGIKRSMGGDLTSVCDDPVCGRVVCNVVSITESFSRDIFLASLRRRPIDYSFPSVRSNKTHRDRLYRPWVTIRCKFIKNVYAADIVCAFANTCNNCKQNIFANYYRKRREKEREELFIVERKYDFRQRYETTK